MYNAIYFKKKVLDSQWAEDGKPSHPHVSSMRSLCRPYSNATNGRVTFCPRLPFTSIRVLRRLTKTRGKGTKKGGTSLFSSVFQLELYVLGQIRTSNESFIAAFHRCFVRRGHCKELYSDQGTNFIGADSLLRI